MSRRAPAIAPSLLDRLVDACHGVERPQPVQLGRLIDDLEALLNSCCVPPDDELVKHAETANSIFNYGAPAPASLSIGSRAQRQATAKQIEKTIQRFEPRLKRVRVRVEDPNARSNDGRFRIEASFGEAENMSVSLRVRTTSGRTQVTAERP